MSVMPILGLEVHLAVEHILVVREAVEADRHLTLVHWIVLWKHQLMGDNLRLQHRLNDWLRVILEQSSVVI